MILLIDNYDSFTWNLVQRLGEIDRSLRVDVDLLVVRNDKITPDQAEKLNSGKGPDRIIISPGPCTPKEAGCSAAMIERFAGRVPILGVCLGHQTIADMHGMTVTRHAIPVHGKTSPIRHNNSGVFAGLSDPFEATRYHSLVIVESDPFEATRYHSLVIVEDTIPKPSNDGRSGDTWEVSAWTDEVVGDAGEATPQHTRKVVMGLRRVWADKSKKPLEGVQFHPESFLTLEGPKLLKNFLDM